MKSSWIVTPRTNNKAKIRLFCFPYSGAAASIYYPWVDILPGSIEVCAIQYPGHGNRVSETLFYDLDGLLDVAQEALLPYFDKPFAFFGHSMGALVGYELARRLKKTQVKQPDLLFVSGHNAPFLPDLSEPLHNLEEKEFIFRLRELNGTPDEVLQDPELREILIPILRADFSVCETYQYENDQLLDCPICACGGLQDKYVDREGLTAWGKLTTGEFTARFFPGDHFYINTERMYLLMAIAQELNKVVDLRV